MSSGKASSLIHYRFRSSLNYSFVNFDGVSVSVAELKQLVVQKEKLTRLEEFDLQVVDAHSKREYTNAAEQVLRNSMVIVARVPKQAPANGPRSGAGGAAHSYMAPKQKILNPEQLEITDVYKAQSKESPLSIDQLMKNKEIASAGNEEEALAIALRQSAAVPVANTDMSAAAARGQTQRAFRPPPPFPPPANFQCHRCRQRGHWPQACPLLIKTKANGATGGGAQYQGLKFASGIPFNMLEPVDDPNTPGAVITSRGVIAVPKMDRAAYARGKIEKEHFSEAENPAYDPSASPAQQASDVLEMPEDYLCELCSEPMREAVIVPCCGQSYCDTCIRPLLLAQLAERADRGDPSPAGECPKCCTDVLPDKLIPNTQFRRSIKKFLADNTQRRVAPAPAASALLRNRLGAAPDKTPSPSASPRVGFDETPSKPAPAPAAQLQLPRDQQTAPSSLSTVGVSHSNASFIVTSPEREAGVSVAPAQTFEHAVTIAANLTAQPPPGVMARSLQVSSLPVGQLALANANQLSFTSMPPPTLSRPVLMQMGPVLTPASAVAPIPNQNQNQNQMVTLQQQTNLPTVPSTLQPPPTLFRVGVGVGMASSPQIDVQQPPPSVPVLSISTAHPPPNVLTSPPKVQLLASTAVPPPSATNTAKISTDVPPPTLLPGAAATGVYNVAAAGKSPLMSNSPAPDTSLPPPMPMPSKNEHKAASNEKTSSSASAASTSGVGGQANKGAQSTSNSSGSGPSRNKDAAATGSPSKGMLLSQEQFYKLKALALEKELRQRAERSYQPAAAPATKAKSPQVTTAKPAEPKPAPVVTTAPIPTISHDTVVSSSNRKTAASTNTTGSAIPVVISKESHPSVQSASAKRTHSSSRQPTAKSSASKSASKSRRRSPSNTAHRASRSRSHSRSGTRGTRSRSPSRSKHRSRSRSKTRSRSKSRTSRDSRRRHHKSSRSRDHTRTRSASRDGERAPAEQPPAEPIPVIAAVSLAAPTASRRVASKIITKRRASQKDSQKSLDEPPSKKSTSADAVSDAEEAAAAVKSGEGAAVVVSNDSQEVPSDTPPKKHRKKKHHHKKGHHKKGHHKKDGNLRRSSASEKQHKRKKSSDSK